LRIGIIGLGFVGLTLAVAFASKDYSVIGLDVDSSKVDAIRRGIPPFYEDGLENLLREVISKGKLKVTSNYENLRNTDIVFITVGTPPRPDGSQDQTYLMDAIRSLARVWKDANSFKLILIKSTIVPGTSRRLTDIFSRESGLIPENDFELVFNPEFLREGRALEDLLHPSRVVLGCFTSRGCDAAENLWREFYRKVDIEPLVLTMKPEEAELVKYASNAFLATRISFANTIANICEKTPGCDVVNVLEATGLDPRIGRKYLQPGLGYGGSCLPKDVKALIQYSRKVGYEPILLEAVDRVNETQPYKVIEYLLKEYEELKGKIVSILGLAFKPGTSDIRGSVSIKIAEALLQYGAIVKVHDPMALDNFRKLFGDRIVYCKEIIDALRDSDAVIVATEWPEYSLIKPSLFQSLMRNPVIIDGKRIYDPDKLQQYGVKLYAIGRSLIAKSV